MPPLANTLLRTGLALKFNQIRRATESYARDRAAQGQGAIVSYAVAAGTTRPAAGLCPAR